MNDNLTTWYYKADAILEVKATKYGMLSSLHLNKTEIG